MIKLEKRTPFSEFLDLTPNIIVKQTRSTDSEQECKIGNDLQYILQ